MLRISNVYDDARKRLYIGAADAYAYSKTAGVSTALVTTRFALPFVPELPTRA